MRRESTLFEKMMYHDGERYPIYFSFYLGIRGELPVEELSRALVKCARKHPLSAIRVEDVDGKQYISSEGTRLYPIRVVDDPAADWRAEVIKEFRLPFDIKEGPLLRFVLLKREGGTGLVAIFHHAICDGVASVLFFKDLFTFIAQPELEPEEPGRVPGLLELLNDDIIRAVREAPIPEEYRFRRGGAGGGQKGPALGSFAGSDYRIKSFALTEEETAALVKKAKAEETTVHALLSAFYLKSCANIKEESESYTREILSPCSYRPYLKEGAGEHFTPQNGSLMAAVDCSPGRSLGEIARDIKRELGEDLHRYKTLIHFNYIVNEAYKDIETVDDLFNKPTVHFTMSYDVSFSNIGRIDLAGRYGSYEIEEIYGPTFSAFQGERVLGLNTHEGKMHFTLIFDANHFPVERAGRIIEGFLALIRE